MRFCYIEVLFHYFTITGAENNVCYIKDFIIIIEVHYNINVLLLCLLFAFPKNSFITDLPTFLNIPKRPDTSTPLAYCLSTSQNFSLYPHNHSLNKKSWNQEFHTQKYPCHITGTVNAEYHGNQSDFQFALVIWTINHARGVMVFFYYSILQVHQPDYSTPAN